MKPATNSLAKKKYAIPHVYIILLIIILLATVLTYIVPAGQFDRETVDNVKMVIPGTYHRIDQTPVNLFDMFVAIPQGFVSMANIVILIYMCVAGMGILTSTGALERVFGSFISKVGAKGRVVMLIIFYAFFFVRGGLTGSVNSPIAFIPLVVTLCLAVGYDVMTALGIVAVGALVGFLWYNSFPAQVFMGDTGSLSIGGIIAVFALCIRKELLLPLLCGIFLVESLSVMLQVSYFKYTKRKYGEGRRILLMSPLHHHYQKQGFFETKIVTRFWIVSLLLAAITLVTLKIR